MQSINRVESGAAVQEEVETLLGLLCASFGMDVEAAKPIFTQDPYFDLDTKRVLRVDGTIVSCLTIVERDCFLGENIVRVAGLAGVATDENERRKGYASRLIADTLKYIKGRGVPLCALFSNNPEYYAKLGWRLCDAFANVSVDVRQLPASPLAQHVRTIEDTNIDAVAHIYDRAANGRTLYCLRDEKRWQYLIRYVRHTVAYCPPGQEIQGYLCFDYQTDLDNSGRSGPASYYIRVLEMHAVTEAARQALTGYLGLQSGARRVQYSCAAEEPGRGNLLFAGVPASAYTTEAIRVPRFMTRIVSLSGLLGALSRELNGNAQRFGTPVGLVLHDTLLSPEPEAIRLTGNGDTTRVTAVTSAQIREERLETVEGDAAAWSAVAVGQIAFEEACRQNVLKASSTRAIDAMSPIFPNRALFLPAADHF